MAFLFFWSTIMERQASEPAGTQQRREASARPSAGSDERRERPRPERVDPIDDRTPEEAGYGYGV